MRRVLAVIALLLAAPAAHAGTRFSLGPGKVPHVLVEPAGGTAHVVWLDGKQTKECNVPRGATSCAPQVVDMGYPADSEPDRPWLLRAPDGTLYIYVARYVANDAWLARSTDGGATWQTGIQVYKASTAGIVGTDITEPVLFPDGEVTIASFNGGGNVFAARLDGSEADGGPVAQLAGAGGFKYDLQVVPTAGGGMLAVAHDGPGSFWAMAP